MFTGIVEALGKVVRIEEDRGNRHFYIESSISDTLKVDQSVSHDGVCLTVVSCLWKSIHQVTAIAETLRRSNLGGLQRGDEVNLERCMPANGRFDGHIVQGHVDQTAVCTAREDQHGSWLFRFRHEPSPDGLVVPKGSITVNGISLTVVDAQADGFSVAVIPYTLEHTNLKSLQTGGTVNIEFDIIGKYVRKMTSYA